MRTKRLGDMLLELGLITEGQLKEALDYQAKEKERLGTTLVKHQLYHGRSADRCASHAAGH